MPDGLAAARDGLEAGARRRAAAPAAAAGPLDASSLDAARERLRSRIAPLRDDE